jgi:hypothetical protein
MILATVRRAALLGALAIGTASCANDPVATLPSAQSLFTPQFSGNWIGTASVTDMTPYVVDGCSVTTYDQRVVGTFLGNERVTLALTQDGTKLEGRLGSATSGLACSYSGTTDANTIALDAATCDAPVLILRCPAQPPSIPESAHSMTIIGSTIQGSIVGGRLTGTLATAFHIDEDTRVTVHSNISVARP